MLGKFHGDQPVGNPRTGGDGKGILFQNACSCLGRKICPDVCGQVFGTPQKLRWQWKKNTIFGKRDIFTHGWFSSVIVNFQGCKYLFNFLNFKNFTPGLVLHIPKIKEKTRDFMQVCEKSGAEAITVHMRLREERPAEPAHWDEISRLWDAVQVTGGTG